MCHHLSCLHFFTLFRNVLKEQHGIGCDRIYIPAANYQKQTEMWSAWIENVQFSQTTWLAFILENAECLLGKAEQPKPSPNCSYLWFLLRFGRHVKKRGREQMQFDTFCWYLRWDFFLVISAPFLSVSSLLLRQGRRHADRTGDGFSWATVKKTKQNRKITIFPSVPNPTVRNDGHRRGSVAYLFLELLTKW